jgi:hypothetical protein
MNFNQLNNYTINMKKILFLILAMTVSVQAQQKNSMVFWDNLTKLCGQSFEGQITKGAREGDGFTGEKLVMEVLSCKENEIKIPFHVGNNHSRTWVITKNKKGILTLKHDHRHEDGSEDKITQYGGTSPNLGSTTLQYFPADQFTQNLIDYAFSNIWWITLNEKTFSYNLAKVGSDRTFSVSFDLTKPTVAPQKPWGWK